MSTAPERGGSDEDRDANGGDRDAAAGYADAPGGDWDATHDVILVGSGAGSLAAAIRLAAGGLRPLILERAALVGGTSAYSGGIVWAPDNHRMRAKAMADSAAEALDYLDAVSLGRGSGELARAYVERVPAVLKELERETALTWMSYPGLPDYFAEIAGGKLDGRCLLPQPTLVSAALEEATSRVPELALVRPSVHFPATAEPWAAGRALVGCLWLRALEDGVPFELETRVESLVSEGGAVVGVEVEGPGGRRRLRARHGVLLGNGGFEWDEPMTRASVPTPALHPQTPPGQTGDGQRMAAELGAELALMDLTNVTPALRVPGERNGDGQLFRLFFQELTWPHSILVNDAGRRFANETFFQDVARGWAEFDSTTAGHPNLPMHFVFDEAYARRHGLPAGLAVGPYLTRHASLAELAGANGIDPAGLAAQVERFNADVEAGHDDEFGRGATAYQRAFAPPREDGGNPTLGTVAEPLFYRLEVFPATSGHRGGVVCDDAGRVLDVRGATIPGLYACGAVAAGLLTGSSYLSGTSLGLALVFGTAAAETMCAGSGG